MPQQNDLPTPVTYSQKFYAKAARMDVELPEAITPEQKYLKAIAEGGDSGDAYTKAETDELLAGKANTSSLAEVATSGSYNDLSNKPTIPAAQVNADWNASSGVAQILNKPTLGTAAAANTTTSITSGGTGLPTSGTVYSVTGDKTSLTTTVKTDLVSAINEINGTIGDINTILEEVL